MRKNKKYLRKKHAYKAVKITLISITALVVVVVAAAGLYVNHLLNQVDYADSDETFEPPAFETDANGNIIMPGESTKPEETGGATDDLGEPAETLDPSQVEDVAKEAEDLANDQTPLQNSPDVINVLLIGVDARTPGQLTNSDVMMLLSVNKAKKTITLSSLMRDMYVAIPGVGNTKLNHANAIGGPDLLLKTVRDNFRINVSNYMLVDFYSMARIVDVLGGVTVTVTEEEVPHINSSVRLTNEKQGLPRDQGLLSSAGTHNLTGAQAVGYSRIRYVGNADFGRTQRQRTVMTAIFNKVKGSSITTLNNLALTILPQVRTNISKTELLSYMALVPQAASYPMKQLQIPAQGSFSFATIGGMSYLLPDLKANRDLLASTIY